MIEINQVSRPPLAVLRISGELNRYSAAELESAVARAIHDQHSTVQLDLSKLNYADSAGLGLLVALHQRLELKKVSLEVINPTARMLNLLRMLNLDQALTVRELVTTAGELFQLDQGDGSSEPSTTVASSGSDSTQDDRDRLRLLVHMQRALLQASIDQSPDYIFATDASDRVIIWNPAMVRLTGRWINEIDNLDEALGALASENHAMQEQLRVLLTTNSGHAPTELMFADAQGNQRIISWQCLAVRSEDGAVIGRFANGHDITELRKATLDKAQSDERYRFLAEHMAEGLALVKNATIIHVNPALAKLCQSSESDLLGNRFYDIFAQDRQDAVKEFLDISAENGQEPIQFETKLSRSLDRDPTVVVAIGQVIYKDEPAQLIMIRDKEQAPRLWAHEDLVTTCAQCGNVKIGDGSNWLTAEDYLRQVLRAQLTHAICPSCQPNWQTEAEKGIKIELPKPALGEG